MWKDIYILSDARKLFNAWSLFHLAVACGLVLLLASILESRERDVFTAVYACVIYSGWTVIVSLRFDSLMTAEFRERTWGSLMLLPVDPRLMLVEKIVAAIWEQRFAVFPLGVSVLALLAMGSPTTFMAYGMTMVIATLSSAMLCQMTCITQFVGKVWWIGPIQVVGFAFVVGISIGVWINCGVVPGFLLCALILMIVLVLIQKMIVDPLALKWVEP